VVGTLLSMGSVAACVVSVASNVAIEGWVAVVVGVGSFCLASAVSAVVGSSLAAQIWGIPSAER
jgi:hypothetical protein